MYRDTLFALRSGNPVPSDRNSDKLFIDELARCWARQWAGVFGAAVFVSALVAAAILQLQGRQRDSAPMILALVLVWPLIAGAMTILRWLFRPALRRVRSSGHDPSDAILRKEAAALARWRLDKLRAGWGRSYGVLLAAAVIIAPLSLHLLVSGALPLLVGHVRFSDAGRFSPYVLFAMGGTWLPHIFVACRAFRFARDVAVKFDAGERKLGGALRGLSTAGLAAVFAVPSGMLLCLIISLPLPLILGSALIVFVTGCAYLPLAFWAVSRTMLREYERQASLAATLPTRS